jgi:hypothetical protein
MSSIEVLSITDQGYAEVKLDLEIDGEIRTVTQSVILPTDKKKREKKLLEYAQEYQNSFLSAEEAKTEKYVILLKKEKKSFFEKLFKR